MAPKLLKQCSKMILKWCPSPDVKKSVELEQLQRLEGFGYTFMMGWTSAQIFGFCAILISFLFSDFNRFMQTEDCCEADTILTNDLGLPLTQCSQESCKLYNFVFNLQYTLVQDRPREPENGDFSIIFEYEEAQHCCNLAESTNTCCSRLPFRSHCGSVMWAACVSGVCSMIMTQVIIQGFFGLFARKNCWMPIVMVIPAAFIRVITFFLIYYIFFAFLFAFIFFWIAMQFCDNPHAYNWYKFGYFYVKFFFIHIRDVLESSVTKWDGNMDMDAFVGAHSIYAVCGDFVFTIIYFIIYHIKDDKGRYIDLAYFKL